MRCRSLDTRRRRPSRIMLGRKRAGIAGGRDSYRSSGTAQRDSLGCKVAHEHGHGEIRSGFEAPDTGQRKVRMDKQSGNPTIPRWCKKGSSQRQQTSVRRQSRAKHEYCAKKRTSQRRLNSEDFPTFGRPTIPIFRLFLTLPNLAAAVWLQWQNFSNEKHTDCNDMDDCKSATSTRNQVPKVEQQC